MARKGWFRWASGALPLDRSASRYRSLGLLVFAFVVIFDVATYNYYRGSVVTPFHSGPVSPTKHHLSLTRAVLNSDGSVSFHVYLDAGTPEAPVHVVTASLLDAGKEPVAHWDTATLSSMPKTAFVNDYDYNKFGPGPFGIRAPLGAAATITLPPSASGGAAGRGLSAADGRRWTILLCSPGAIEADSPAGEACGRR